MQTIIHNKLLYLVVDDTPTNGDLVLTDNHGVWTFKDETGTGSAPMPYWANKKTCKKMILFNNICDAIFGGKR